MKKKILIGIITIIILLLALIIAAGGIYTYNLSPIGNETHKTEVQIEKGMTSRKIAAILKEKNLIRNEQVFLLYLKLHKVNDMKYGVYLFSEDMSVKDIVNSIRTGTTYNPDEVTITFKEGINMRDIASVISENTNNTYESVIEKSNDINYINSLKEKYWFITDDILNDELYYKLEGYLYPDTYKLSNKDVSVEYIFNKMLDEMAKNLEEYKNYDYSSLTIHERLSLASMIEKEAAKDADRNLVSSVFINRINRNISLGSDVTTRYAVKLDDPKQPLTIAQYRTKSPYNTRLTDGSMNGKLPVGPISTISKSSIDAAFNPSDTDYIYFIANINTLETFFFNNSKDFENKKQELSSVNNGF